MKTPEDLNVLLDELVKDYDSNIVGDKLSFIHGFEAAIKIMNEDIDELKNDLFASRNLTSLAHGNSDYAMEQLIKANLLIKDLKDRLYKIKELSLTPGRSELSDITDKVLSDIYLETRGIK